MFWGSLWNTFVFHIVISIEYSFIDRLNSTVTLFQHLQLITSYLLNKIIFCTHQQINESQFDEWFEWMCVCLHCTFSFMYCIILTCSKYCFITSTFLHYVDLCTVCCPDIYLLRSSIRLYRFTVYSFLKKISRRFYSAKVGPNCHRDCH